MITRKDKLHALKELRKEFIKNKDSIYRHSLCYLFGYRVINSYIIRELLYDWAISTNRKTFYDIHGKLLMGKRLGGWYWKPFSWKVRMNWIERQIKKYESDENN